MVLTMTDTNDIEGLRRTKQEIERDIERIKKKLRTHQTDQSTAIMENTGLWSDLRSKGWPGRLISAIGEIRNDSKLRKIESKNLYFVGYLILQLGCYLFIQILQIAFFAFLRNRNMNKIMKNCDTILSLTKEVNDCNREINRLKEDILGINEAIEREKKQSKTSRKPRRERENISAIGKSSTDEAQQHSEEQAIHTQGVPDNPTSTPGRKARK